MMPHLFTLFGAGQNCVRPFCSMTLIAEYSRQLSLERQGFALQISLREREFLRCWKVGCL